MTLRSRLLVGMAVVAIALSVVVLYNTQVTRRELIGQIDERLKVIGRSSEEREWSYTQPGDGSGADQASLERISDIYEGYIDPDGNLHTIFAPNAPGEEQAGAPKVTVDDVPRTGTSFVTMDSTGGETTYRVMIKRADSDHSLAYVFAVPIDDVQATIDRLELQQSVAALIALAALGLVGWWVLHLGIRPMRRMTDVATKIAEGDLSVRVPESRPSTESGSLANALNQMLGRLQGALDDKSRSEERLRQFVADASHELRTPITTIRGYAELYRIGGLSRPDALHDAMRRTEQQATRMSRLVDDMLTLAKLDRERPIDRQPVDLVEVAGDAVADGRVRSPDRDFAFAPRVEHAVVTGDADRLRQAIDNLVSNAVLHTDSAIEVTVDVVADDVVVEVIDHGAGMPPEIAARVTERFFRADASRARSTGGNGLGLSIVDSIIAAHHGSVVVDSAEGRGTTMRVELPNRASETHEPA